MSKKLASVMLSALLICTFCLNAGAIMYGSYQNTSLTFSGTTANCKATVSASGKSINVTLELWCGNTLVRSWSGSGTSYLVVSGTCSVTSGKTYTLKAHGTIDGTAFTATSVTKKCG